MSSSPNNIRYALQRGLSLARVSMWIHAGGEGVAPSSYDYALLGLDLSDTRVEEVNHRLASPGPEAVGHNLQNASKAESLFDRWVQASPVGHSLYDQRALAMAKIAAFALSEDVMLDPALIPSESDYLKAGIFGVFQSHGSLSASVAEVNAVLRSLPQQDLKGISVMAADHQDVGYPVHGPHDVYQALQSDVHGFDSLHSEGHLVSHDQDSQLTSVELNGGYGELPAIPSEIPAIPDVLPGIPTDIPAIPSVLPAVPKDIPAVPGYSVLTAQEKSADKIDLMSLLGHNKDVLVANINGESYPIFSNRPIEQESVSLETDMQSAPHIEASVLPGVMQPPNENDSWRYHFG